MSEKQTWIDRLSRITSPILITAITTYGIWDLAVKPWIKEPQAEACTTTVTGVFLEELSLKPDQSGKEIEAPEGLPVVVPAREKRAITVRVDNPKGKSVVYNWRATYGNFASPITNNSRSVYTAPSSLVNDTVSVEARLQGCSTAKRSVKIAVVPSTSNPTEELTEPSPASPVPLPSPSINPLAPTQPHPSTPSLGSTPEPTMQQ
ncbi:MAG: hypothetical protein HC866_21910 [Leptolyngbyaceae cyanobacterium RU_5_1]|nr:hypothetical protein [Leptolyngbyaceae cyanobacterium RU_5_1]